MSLSDNRAKAKDAVAKNENVIEKCVSCGADTNVSVSLHIDYRMFYVEGAGQCCQSCFEKI